MAEDILGKLGEAVVLLRADGSQLSDDMKKEKDKLEKQLDSISSDLKGVGKGLTAGVTAPILAIGAAAVSAGLVLDDALDGIRAKTGLTGDALKALEGDFTAVFTSVPDDAMVVSDALTLIYQRTGLTGTALQGLTTTMLDLSRITGTDVATNVRAAADTFAIWNIATDQQTSSLDFLFKVSQKTGTSVTDLLTSVSSAQPTFAAFNMGFEESVALMGQLQKSGLDAGGAVAALKKAVATFAEANVPAQEGLQKTFDIIKQLGPGTEATAMAIDVFGVRAGPQLAAAIATGKFSVEELVKTVKGSSDTIQQATKDTGGFNERLGELRNKATAAFEPLGTKLLELGERALPVLVMMGEKVGDLITWFTDLPGPVQDVALGFIALAAAAGPVLYVGGALVGSYKELLSVWGSVAKGAGYLTSQFPLMASGLGLVAKGASVVGVAFAGWKLGTWIGETTGLTDKIQVLASKMMGLTDAQIADSMASQRHARAMQDQVAPTSAVSTATAGLDAEIAKLAAGLGKGSTNAKDFSNQLGKGKVEIDEYTKKVQSLAAQFGKDVVTNGLAYADALKKIGGTASLTADEIMQFAGALDAAYVKLKLLGQNSGPEFDKVRQAWLTTQAAIMNSKISTNPFDVLNGMKGFKLPPIPIQSLPINLTDPWSVLKNLPSIKLGPPPSVMKSFGTALMQGFTGPGGFTEQLGPTILQALTGGGSVSDSIGGLAGVKLGEAMSTAFGPALTKGLGKTVGGVLGSLLPGIGAMAGPLISGGLSKAFGAVQGMFGNSTKGSRQDFAKQMGFGDLDQLYRDLMKAGDAGAKLANIGMNVIGRNDKAGNEKWMQDVLKFYDDVAAKKQKDLQDTADAQDRLQNAIQKYGFSIEELGPKWRAQQLTEQAKELILDFTALTASGIDMDVVLGKMGGSIQDFVTIALKTGTEIPEAMKPMLQRMVEMGTLTDENGVVITDLTKSGIVFSTSMTKGFQSVVDKLDELIRKLTGELTDGLNNLPNPTVTVEVEYDYGNGPQPPGGRPGGSNSDPNYPEFAKGGIGNFGAGTMAVLHGQEAVIPLERLDKMWKNARNNNGLTPEGMLKAMKGAGMDRPNVHFAPKLEGALAGEMYEFASKMWPILIQVLQNDGPKRASLAGTLRRSN